MPLGKNTQAFFEHLKLDAETNPPKPLKESTLAEIIANSVASFADLATPFPSECQANDFIQGSITLSSGREVIFNSYIPPQIAEQALLPTVIYFYGGGFCLPLFKQQQAPMATVALQANCQVICIDYPLAPEHSIDEIIDISYETVKQLYIESERYKIAPQAFILSGCSSGGTIAALLTNRSLDDTELNIHSQILFSPLVDCSLETHYSNEYVHFQQQDLLQTDEALEFYLRSLALSAEEAKSPLISPIYNDNLNNLPNTLIIVGEYDSLRGDGAMYAKKLRQQGCDARLITCDGQIHVFLIFRKVLNDGDDPAILAANFIKENLN